MYGPVVSLRLRQNLYTEFGAFCHLWLSPFLDSLFTLLAVMISLIPDFSFFMPERLVPPVKIRCLPMSFHPAKHQLLPRMCRIFFTCQCCSFGFVCLFVLSGVIIIIYNRIGPIRGYLAIPEVKLEVIKGRH